MTDDEFFSIPALALGALMLDTPEETAAALKAVDDWLREELGDEPEEVTDQQTA